MSLKNGTNGDIKSCLVFLLIIALGFYHCVTLQKSSDEVKVIHFVLGLIWILVLGHWFFKGIMPLFKDILKNYLDDSESYHLRKSNLDGKMTVMPVFSIMLLMPLWLILSLMYSVGGWLAIIVLSFVLAILLMLLVTIFIFIDADLDFNIFDGKDYVAIFTLVVAFGFYIYFGWKIFQQIFFILGNGDNLERLKLSFNGFFNLLPSNLFPA